MMMILQTSVAYISLDINPITMSVFKRKLNTKFIF